MGLDLWRAEGIAVDDVEQADGERSGVAQILVYDDGDNSIAVAPGGNRVFVTGDYYDGNDQDDATTIGQARVRAIDGRLGRTDLDNAATNCGPLARKHFGATIDRAS